MAQHAHLDPSAFFLADRERETIASGHMSSRATMTGSG
jgi:hypothetical protein